MRAAAVSVLLAVALASGAAPPPIFLVIALDGVRPERLPCGGGDTHAAPLIGTLCATGVAFTHAYAQSSWAPASFASVLTATRPTDHGVNAGDDALAAGRPTLGTALATAGWLTAAWSSDPADAARGLLRGFADVGFLADTEPTGLRLDAAERAAFPVLAWVQAHHRDLGARGAVLLIHADGARLGAVPPAEYLRRFVPLGDTGRVAALEARVAAFEVRFAGDETAALAAVSDAGVAVADAAIARILEELHEPEVARRVWVVLFAPYGEALGEHGIVGHGTTLYDEAIHVPLVVAPPAGRSGGRRCDGVVELADVTPTILDLAGLPPEPAFRGRSLRAAIEGRTLAARDAVAELVAPNPLRAHVRATIGPDLRKRIGRPDGTTEVYDLRADPGERQNLTP